MKTTLGYLFFAVPAKPKANRQKKIRFVSFFIRNSRSLAESGWLFNPYVAIPKQSEFVMDAELARELLSPFDI